MTFSFSFNFFFFLFFPFFLLLSSFPFTYNYFHVQVLATFSFRTAFWAIVASGDFEETSAGYFILVEPPR